MTARLLAAEQFVAVFEFVASLIGRARAFIDARVQAARRYYAEARA